MPIRVGAALLLILCLCTRAPGARAESALRLPAPDRFGAIPAVTYDADGHPIGQGLFRVERRENGNVWIEAETAIDAGGNNAVSAELEPMGNGELRLVSQFSRSHDVIGEALGLLQIDHRAHLARCFPPQENGSASEPEELELPAQDRVANVPLNLLFLPLVRGQEKRVDFQILLCRGGPRLVDAKGTVMRREAKHGTGTGDLVEIEYELDLPMALAFVARPFLPRISMWFDSQEPGAWLGHRMPLYAKGPTVLVVRSGVSLESLGIPE